ncbi:MAG: hypothetical protein KKB50_09340 [Planctomycetes bacterium]|nr:hypothetical protein [Planctomycetota bacterium]
MMIDSNEHTPERLGARESALRVPRGCSLIRWLVAAALVAVLNSGCQQRQHAEDRVQARWEGIGRTWETYVAREADSPPHLHRADRYIRQRLSRDARAAERDFRQVEVYLERDLRRWRERQPIYRNKAAELLRGKPETIEHTAIHLFL